MYPNRDVTFITTIMNSFVLYVNWSILDIFEILFFFFFKKFLKSHKGENINYC